MTNPPSTKGIDFSAQVRQQPKGFKLDDPGSPEGGRFYFPDPAINEKNRMSMTVAGNNQPRHFKLDGEMPPEMPQAQGPSQVQTQAAPAEPAFTGMAGEVPDSMGLSWVKSSCLFL